MDTTATAASPLEVFVREYLETSGGAWDEVEPQVYDVLLPGEAGLKRLAFDPEALPEHPGAELASFGTPLIDRLLDDALRRGRSGHFYLVGLNLEPHNLLGRLRKALTLAPPLELSVARVRALHFTQVVYWFRLELVEEQKEQTILPVAVDLHYGREVRHLDALLAPSRLAVSPAQPLPEARRLSVAAGYEVARAQALRTVAALANVRARQLTERRDRQAARVSRYYADLREELEEQAHRARNAEEAAARREQRLSALEREEQLRLAEVEQKSRLRAHLRLLQVLRIDQPKLLVQATVGGEKQPAVPLELVWDTLTEAVEAPACPNCGRPTFALSPTRQGVVCPACPARPVGRPGAR
jgi:hypothetical protein